MRPHELTVEGFRSYRDKATFDWRGRRLVGIVGPIGSGKSSIIDAISFALFGKTPAVERDTKSLIHQLCDQCHVELVFEVEGQVWRVRRAMRRGKGASGHTLELLAGDEPEPHVVETITLERHVNERIEQLLGMDFKAFCRSVLLAQNRFSEFLKATAGDRDKVLKGVFGYEVLDAAQRVARSRLDRAEVELDALADERRKIDEARERLEEARTNAASAERRLRELESAAPDVERLSKEREAASADAGAYAERITSLIEVKDSLPDPGDVERAAADASAAEELVASARAALEAAEQTLAQRLTELGDVASRLGDRERFRSFDRLVQQQEQESRALEAARAELDRAEQGSAAAVALVEARRAGLEATVAALTEITDAEGGATQNLERARAVLADAQHAEMAHELRGSLLAGEPCPVCDQPVRTIPKAGAAPKVAVATRAVAKAEAALEKARHAKEQASQTRASVATAVDEASKRTEGSAENRDRTAERLRAAEAAIATTNGQLVEWLGEGDARTLLEARQAELDAAERAEEEARVAVDTSRARLDQTREAAVGSAQRLTSFANRLSGAWGRLGEDRDVAADPAAIQEAFVSLDGAVRTGRGDAEERRAAATARVEAAASASAELVASVGLSPGDDFRAELTQAGVHHGAAATEVAALEAEIGRANELEGRVVEAEARRDLARRLADDLKPSRFLAFLLEEERSELAELGSEHFEQLTDGAYRFADDGSFAVQDLNAAGTVRKADSLSGGETFLASLALALALAAMVARGGGRLDSFFLDEGFGSLDPEHLDRAMDGIGRLVSENERRLVVLVSHVAEMRDAVEDLIVLEKHVVTGDTIVLSGADPAT
ncbi:MAG: AAA family ATPase [Actinomycetota bacterium]